MIPQLMCASCRHVFPAPEGYLGDTAGESGGAAGGEPVTCPACGHHAPPAGVMRPSGFPSLDTFVRNWRRAHRLEPADALDNETDHEAGNEPRA